MKDAHAAMLKHSEKVEDKVRDRIQDAKDDIWDEFSEKDKNISD